MKTSSKLSLISLAEEELLRLIPIRRGDRIFVACSGGPDSVALFHLLAELRQKYGFQMGIFHVNHGLRGRASLRDESFVKNLARKFHVPFASRKLISFKGRSHRRKSVEELAREMRYDALVKMARRYRIRKITLGHTEEDQAETVLMRVFQGTGLRGLCGIRPSFRKGGVHFLRPLLGAAKSDILHFLKARRIAYCEDATNRSTAFLRNRIRLNLLPRLKKEINPRVVSAVARIPAILQREEELLSSLEEAAWRRVFRKIRKNQLLFDREAFLKFPSPLQFRILERGLKRLDPSSGISYEAWRILERGLPRKRFRHSLPRDIDFTLTPSSLRLYKK